MVVQMQLQPVASLAEIIHDDFPELARGDLNYLHRITVPRV